MRSRLLRSVVSLLLICCLIVNLSPIRAKAVVGTVAVGGMGIAATLFSMAMGVIWLDLTADMVNALGESLKAKLYGSADTDEKSQIIDVWIEGIELDLGGGSGDDPGENDPAVLAGLLSIPKELMQDVVEWVAGLIGGDTVEVPLETAPEGYAYYNGVLFPLVPTVSGCSYGCIVEYNGSVFRFLAAKNSLYKKAETSINFTGSLYQYELVNGVWTYKYHSASGGSLPLITKHIWTSSDILLNSELYLAGSEPVSVSMDSIQASTMVGTIPGQIQDGSISTDDYVIDDIYYGDIIGNLDSVVDDLNLIGYDLADGVMDHDAYLDMTKSPLPKLAETPKITQDLSTNRVTYTVGDAPEPLTVVAESTDRGTLTYQWYQVKQGGLVHPRIEGATDATFYPPTTEAGSWRYYCRVTNTTSEGLTAFTSTKSAIIDVLDPSVAGPMGDTQSGTFINSLVDALLDGINSLFVPDAAAMAAQKAKWDTLLADRFGALYEAGDAVSDLTGVFADQGVQKTILFPSVTIPLVDSNFTFGGWEVQVVPDGIDVLVEPLKLIIDIVCTLATLVALRRRFEKVLEGHGG